MAARLCDLAESTITLLVVLGLSLLALGYAIGSQVERRYNDRAQYDAFQLGLKTGFSDAKHGAKSPE